MQVRYEAKAVKDMKAITPVDRTRIRQKIEQYAADPASQANNVKALQGSDLYRLRVGDYRAIFAVEEDGTLTIMVVIRVRHRREVYD